MSSSAMFGNSAATVTAPFVSLLECARSVFAAFRDAIRVSREVKRLMNLSDAELAALGLTRSDVPRHVMFGD